MDARKHKGTRTIPRRPVQACSACKKSKVRCELIQVLDLSQDVKCHRCSALGHRCSFSEMDKAIFSSYIASKLTESPRNSQSPDTDRVASADAVDRPPSPSQSEFWTTFRGRPPFTRNKEPLGTTRDFMRSSMKNSPATTLPQTPPADTSLTDILSPEQIDELLQTFASLYLPWLNFTLIRDSDGAALEIACCAVASRHLSPHFRSLLSARLQKLTENTVAKLAQSLESVQALVILALWCPPGSTEHGTWDAQVLIASAVSIALNLRLNEASTKVMELRSTGTPESQLDHLTKKARLWTALTIVESMLCLGCDRKPLTSRSVSDIDFIPRSVLSPDTLAECRDCRLRLLGQMLNAVESAAQIHLTSQETTDIENWYDARMKVLGTLDHLRHFIIPLEVLSDYDQPYFHILFFILHSCRLLILYDSVHDVSRVYEKPGTSITWFLEFKPHGISTITIWGRENLQLSEAILVGMLQTDALSLGSCPDVVFYLLAFAAQSVFYVKGIITKLNRSPVDAMDKLLTRSMQHLSATASSDDHPAAGAAKVVSTMLTDESAGGVTQPLTSSSQDQAPVTAHLQGLQQESSEVPQVNLDAFTDINFWTELLGYNPLDDSQLQSLQSE